MSAVDFHGRPGCPFCGQRIAIHPRRLAFVFGGRDICEHLVWCQARIGSGSGQPLTLTVRQAAWIEQALDAEGLQDFFRRFVSGPPGERPIIHAGYTLQALRLSRPVSVNGAAIYTTMVNRLLESVRNSLALAAAGEHRRPLPRLGRAA